MGAYLYYKLKNKKLADEYNRFIATTETGKRLIEANSLLTVYDNEDISWAKNGNSQFLQYYVEQFGKGVFKASGVNDEEIENAGCKNLEEFFELVTQFFEEAQTKYEMYFAAWSCAFSLDEDYFTIQQMKRITNNGEYLSGESVRPEKFAKLKELLKEQK